MAIWNDDEWEKVLERIATRAAHDPIYRRLTQDDAAAAVKAVTGNPAPDGFTVRCVINEAEARTVVLPPFIPEIQEMSDEELEQVAGGDFGVTWRR